MTEMMANGQHTLTTDAVINNGSAWNCYPLYTYVQACPCLHHHDAEAKALSETIRLLGELDRDARARVLAYLKAKYDAGSAP